MSPLESGPGVGNLGMMTAWLAVAWWHECEEESFNARLLAVRFQDSLDIMGRGVQQTTAPSETRARNDDEVSQKCVKCGWEAYFIHPT